MKITCRVTERDYIFIGNYVGTQPGCGSTVVVSGTSTNIDGESECSDIVINADDAKKIISHLTLLFHIDLDAIVPF